MSELPISSSGNDPAIEYERLWLTKGFPDLAEFLSSQTRIHPGKLSEILRIDLRQRWFTQSRIHAEAYLEKYAAVAVDTEAAIDLIYAEYLLTERDQGSVDNDLFLARFPEFASTLRSQFELHRLTASESDGENNSSHSTIMAVTHRHAVSNEIAEGDQVRTPKTIDNRFQIVRELGRGAMGIVWEAIELNTGRRVAIKSLIHRWTNDKSDEVRFLLEGKLAASVSHPNSAFLFESICKNDERFLVMELMPGRTLKDVAGLGPQLSVAKAVDYLLDAIDGLEAAHRAGVIHRDVKPSNCFLDSSGRVKIGDYGLSIFSRSVEVASDGGKEFSGTPAFASPEQVRCETVTVLSDQYSLGATLFYLLTKRPPFVGNLQSVFSQILNEEAPKVTQFVTGIPNELASIIAKCLRKNPVERFSDLSMLYQALLPYSVTTTTLGNTGRRLIAYAIDELLIMMASSLCFVVILAIWLFGSGPILLGDESVQARVRFLILFASILNVLIEFGYFAILEGVWGAGIGKRIVRLRVTNPDGGPPGLRRSCVRAFFVPMACGTSLIHSIVTSFLSTNNMLDASDGANPIQGAFTSIAIGIGFNLPILFCLSSMRATNGFRGWHELFSKTKTVYLRQRDLLRRSSYPTTSNTSPSTIRSFGPFDAFKKQYETETFVVWDAFDRELGRNVWIVEHHSADDRPESEVSASRFRVDRSTRIRLLQDGIMDRSFWSAYEATPGTPLRDFSSSKQLATWDQIRELIFQLVTEMQSAIQDSTLPNPLTLDHLWISSTSRLVVLDQPMQGLLIDREPMAKTCEEERVRELVKEVFSRCCRHKVLPAQAHEFKEVLEKPIDLSHASFPTWIQNIVRRLEKSRDQSTTLRWDDRFGLLGLTVALEAWIYPFLILASGVFWVENSDLGLGVRLLCHLLIAISLPMIQPLMFGRNLLFRLSRIQVTRTNGQRASRLRNIAREFVAWFPWTFTWAMLGWGVAVVFGNCEITPDNPAYASDENLLLVRQDVIRGFFCSSVLPLLLLAFGLIWALRSPTRGLQDHIAGTCLFYE